MENKKTWYWAAGVIAALLVIFLAWGGSRKEPDAPQVSPSAPSAGEARSGSDEAGSSGGKTGGDSSEAGYARYMEEETAIMDRMMRDMDLPEESGNAALDFLDGMLPHHEAAVSMAESYLDNGGTHPELKPLAEDIIQAQKAEISQMDEMRDTISGSGKKDQEKADAYRKRYQDMMAQHHDGQDASHSGHGTSHGDSSGNSIDTAFAEGMVLHHQMAVDMAEAILGNTDQEDVLTLARQIIDTQEEEIARMEKVLQEQ